MFRRGKIINNKEMLRRGDKSLVVGKPRRSENFYSFCTTYIESKIYYLFKSFKKKCFSFLIIINQGELKNYLFSLILKDKLF